MIKPLALTILALCLGGLLTTSSVSQELNALKDATERWIQVRNRISQEKGEWLSERELHQGSIDTLTSTRDALTESVEVLEMQGQKLTEAIRDAKDQVAAYDSTNNIILTHVSTYESRIVALAQRLPTPLREELAPLLRKIPAESSSTTPLPNRLQNVVAISTLIDEFNNDLTLTHTIKTQEDGSAMEVRVLYWGLACAYASNTDGTQAWILTPAEGQWKWEAANEKSPQIKQLFDVYDKTIDPVLVQIPFAFQTNGGAQ